MITFCRDIGRPLTTDEIDENLSTLLPRMLPTSDQTISSKKYFNDGEISNIGVPIGTQALRTKDFQDWLPTGLLNIHANNSNKTLNFKNSPLRTSAIIDDNDVITSMYAHNNLKKGITVSTESPVNPDVNPVNDVWIQTTSTSPRTIIGIYYYVNNAWVM
jgi:hypothetical protein